MTLHNEPVSKPDYGYSDIKVINTCKTVWTNAQIRSYKKGVPTKQIRAGCQTVSFKLSCSRPAAQSLSRCAARLYLPLCTRPSAFSFTLAAVR